MNFGQILKQLRITKGLTQNELAKILDVSKSNISKYEAGSVEPNMSVLIRISEYFEVSVDYLLGKNAKNESAPEKENNFFFFFFDENSLLQNTFAKRLKTAIEDKGLTENEFKERISLGCEKVTLFLEGNGEPTADDLIELSQFLDTSIDYLLGQVPKVSNIEKKMLNAFVKLNIDNQDILIGKAKEMIKEQESGSVAADSALKRTGTDNLKK